MVLVWVSQNKRQGFEWQEFIALGGSREERQGREAAHTKCIMEPVTTVGSWNLNMMGGPGLQGGKNATEL